MRQQRIENANIFIKKLSNIACGKQICSSRLANLLHFKYKTGRSRCLKTSEQFGTGQSILTSNIILEIDGQHICGKCFHKNRLVNPLIASCHVKNQLKNTTSFSTNMKQFLIDTIFSSEEQPASPGYAIIRSFEDFFKKLQKKFQITVSTSCHSTARYNVKIHFLTTINFSPYFVHSLCPLCWEQGCSMLSNEKW